MGEQTTEELQRINKIKSPRMKEHLLKMFKIRKEHETRGTYAPKIKTPWDEYNDNIRSHDCYVHEVNDEHIIVGGPEPSTSDQTIFNAKTGEYISGGLKGSVLDVKQLKEDMEQTKRNNGV